MAPRSPPPAAAALTFGRFVWNDVKRTAAAFAKASGVALAFFTAAVLVAIVAGGASPGRSPALAVAVWLAMAAYYALIPALLVGACVAARRLFGWTTLLPPVVMPAVAAAVFSLARSSLASRAHALGEALLVAGRLYHWPATHAVGRLAHAGPAALPFVLLGVLVDAAHLLADRGVLWALAGLCALVAALALASCALALVLTAPPMAWVFVARARRRWGAWVRSQGRP